MKKLYNFLKVKLCYRTYWKQWLAFLTMCFLVFACSEDEDNNNQNFLEKYDNVVWRNPLFVSTPQSIDELSTHELLIFNNENEFLTFYNPHFSDISQEECLNYFGTSNCDACDRWNDGLNSNGETWTITLNNPDALHFTSDNADDNGFSFVEVTVSGDILTFDLGHSNTDDTFQLFYNRTQEENPCN